MAKIIYEFDTCDGEDSAEYDIFSKARDMYCALVDLRCEFRKKAKYSEDSTTTWDDAYDLFCRVLGEYNVPE